jgi:hypothetical protein
MSETPATLNITQLARKLGMSPSWVQRNYVAWGFKPLPQFARPRVLTADAELFLNDRDALRRKYAAPLTGDEMERLAKEAAAFADAGKDWPPRP